MHKVRGANLELKDILAKLDAAANPKAKPTSLSVTYSTSDINKAKSVLERLLNSPDRNEVAYITPVTTEIEEE